MFVANVKITIRKEIKFRTRKIAKVKFQYQISVALPPREIPLSSGWYACKLLVSDTGKVQNITVACALLMEDVTDPAGEAIQISSMRWCRGLPQEERNAKVFGAVCDSYSISGKGLGKEAQTQIVQPEAKTQIVQPEAQTQSGAQNAKAEAPTHGVKKEPLELDATFPKTRKKQKKQPFARTDKYEPSVE